MRQAHAAGAAALLLTLAIGTEALVLSWPGSPPRLAAGATHRHEAGMPMVEVPPSAYDVAAQPLAPAGAQVSRTGSRAVVPLSRDRTVSGLRYQPPADGAAAPQRYAVDVRRGHGRWRTVTHGRWAPDGQPGTASFRATRAREVRLRVREGGPVSLESLTVLGPSRAAAAKRAKGAGRWSHPIGLPIVPTTAVLLPHDKVLTMSAYSAKDYDLESDWTQVSILDVGSRRAGRRQVARTRHQMFCTGVSVLPDGRVLITGGSSPSNTTIYDPARDNFTRGPQMAIPRGYQSSVTLSDGRVFTIGGSWSGGEGGKDAEILDGRQKSWRTLPKDRATSILTDDEAGMFRADNHAWMFADRGGSVFHAGPSRAMHWFGTQGDGHTTKAGRRGDADDQMNGNAVMYARGRILTVGGAPSYSDSPATARAWTIDIRRGPGKRPKVHETGRLPQPRALLNTVVLPDGKVLATGGQERSLPFSDADSALTAALWSPHSGTWRELRAEAIPRNYHSWSLLLPDGRVVAGGGGLCGDCETNHPDVEIFTPPYLLHRDGSLRSRPKITSKVPGVVHRGQKLTLRTHRRIASWSLVRTGSVTHSINSDQRRTGLSSDRLASRLYRVQIPRSGGVVPPGSYLLFALDRHGTPSRARWVRIP